MFSDIIDFFANPNEALWIKIFAGICAVLLLGFAKIVFGMVFTLFMMPWRARQLRQRWAEYAASVGWQSPAQFQFSGRTGGISWNLLTTYETDQDATKSAFSTWTASGLPIPARLTILAREQYDAFRQQASGSDGSSIGDIAAALVALGSALTGHWTVAGFAASALGSERPLDAAWFAAQPPEVAMIGSASFQTHYAVLSDQPQWATALISEAFEHQLNAVVDIAAKHQDIVIILMDGRCGIHCAGSFTEPEASARICQLGLTLTAPAA
jgi:hypothetical protein